MFRLWRRFFCLSFLAQIIEESGIKTIKQRKTFDRLKTATPEKIIESKNFEYLHKKLRESKFELCDSDSLFSTT